MRSIHKFRKKLADMEGLEKGQIALLVLCDAVITVFSLPYYRIFSPLDFTMGHTSVLFIQVFSAILAIAFIVHILFMIVSGTWREWIVGHKHTGGMKLMFWAFMVVEVLVVFTSIFIGFGPESDIGAWFLPESANDWIWGNLMNLFGINMYQMAVPFRRFVLYLVVALPIPYVMIKAATKDRIANVRRALKGVKVAEEG